MNDTNTKVLQCAMKHIEKAKQRLIKDGTANNDVATNVLTAADTLLTGLAIADAIPEGFSHQEVLNQYIQIAIRMLQEKQT